MTIKYRDGDRVEHSLNHKTGTVFGHHIVSYPGKVLVRYHVRWDDGTEETALRGQRLRKLKIIKTVKI